MKYFKIQLSIINQFVGNIASNKMDDKYNYGGINSVHNLPQRGKIEFQPNFNSVEILNTAKLKDIISSITIPNSGIMVSDNLLEVIREFKLPYETQIFDVNVIYKGDKFHYNYLYIYDSKEEEIFDFENSLFIKTEFNLPKSDFFKLKYNELKRRSLEDYEEITPKSIMLNTEKINTDIFRLDLTNSGYYVTEKLKNAIESSGCNGIEFIPINELKYKHK